MASVYLAVHQASGVEVAVKVLTGQLATQPRFREAFWREAQSVARLHHPNVVRIFDVGVVPESVSQHSTIAVEAPYIVMQYFEGGTLEVVESWNWHRYKRVLLQILDGLAHAHARGVTHRDLKPANVLIDSAGRAHLTDFGIAQIDDGVTGRAVEDRITGTPKYMAPEQIRGIVREQGPWTDLYSLGAMAWRIACGEAPFHGDTTKVLRDHLQTPLPAFDPVFSVPEEFRRWLEWLLAKPVEYRCQRAADAAHVLLSMEPPEAASRMVAALSRTADLDLTTLVGLDAVATADLGSDPMVALEFSSPAMAPDWRSPLDAPSTLARAGMGAFALREPPLVGREFERDALWALMRRVPTSGLQLALVCGPNGIGKSRLARWIAERAHELGAASRMDVQHSGENSSTDGLVGMILRHLRVAADDRQTLEEALNGLKLLDHFDVDVLSSWLRGEGLARVSRRERFVSIGRLLTDLSAQRAVVCVVDDLDRGAETVAFLKFLCDEMPFLPMLVVALCADATELNALKERADLVLDLPALDAPAIGELLDAMLPLEATSRGELIRRSQGNPSHAIQWLQLAIQQGTLRDTGAVFAFTADSLRIDLENVWRYRVDTFLRDELHGPTRAALFAAAVVGETVDRNVWEPIAKSLGAVPEKFIAQLVHAGLAEFVEGGFAFVSGALREALCKAAADANVWVSLNAKVSERLAGSLHERARYARHLEAAQKTAEAIDAYLDAAQYAWICGEFADALALLDRRVEAMDRLKLPARDVRRGLDLKLRGKVVYRTGSREEFFAFAQQAIRTAEQRGWHDVRANLTVGISETQILTGEIDEMFPRLEAAIAVLEDTGKPDELAEALRVMADALVANGETDKAAKFLDRAERLPFPEDHLELRAAIDWSRGDMFRTDGRLDESMSAFRRAYEIYDQMGARLGCGWALNAMGDLHRMRGDLGRAEHELRRAREFFEASGAREAVGVDVNLAIVALARAEWEEAADQFASAFARLHNSHNHFYQMVASIGMVAAEAGRGALGEAIRWLGVFEALAAEQTYEEPDIRTLAMVARDRIPPKMVDLRRRLDVIARN